MDIVGGSISALITYWVVLVAYRLFLSPIAHFPGSKLTAATGWYETYLDIEEWHRQYGPIIRINPWEVHIADADFYQHLYSTKFRYNKPKAWQKRFGFGLSTFDVIEHEHYRRRRLAVAPFFSRQRVLEYLPYVQQFVDRLCDRLAKEYAGMGKPVCLDEAYAALTSDVINYASFGLSYNFLEYPAFESPFTTAVRKLTRSLHIFGHFPWFLALLQSLPQPLVVILNPDLKAVFTATARIRAQIQRLMTEHRNEHSYTKENNYRTVFAEMLHSDHLSPAEKSSLDLLHHEASSITGAGVETTKAALAVASFHILDNPTIYTRLRVELQEAMPDAGPRVSPLGVSLAQLEKLPYLHAVVQEALRLSFGVSQSLVRINPHGPIQYGEYIIPPGTPFKPDKFIPERWFDDNAATNVSMSNPYRANPKHLVAFGTGPRRCLGTNLAMAEMYLALAHIFRRLDLELFETDRSAVDMTADFFIPVPEKGSKGVRILIK